MVTITSGVEEPNREGYNSIYLPKLMNLDFRPFNGMEDPTGWICKADRFFELHHTLEDNKVSLASVNLEWDAQLWYQLLKEEFPIIAWADFKHGLLKRYGPTPFRDFFGDLTKLQQNGFNKRLPNSV
ncbi:hypothetical protein AMTRI_Chr06g172420 [Amborella trichopoda]